MRSFWWFSNTVQDDSYCVVPKAFLYDIPYANKRAIDDSIRKFLPKIARLEGFYFYLVAQIFVCLLWRNMRLSLKQDFDNTCQRKISVPRILYDLCQLTIYPCKQHNHNVWKSPKIAHLFLEAFDMLWLSFSDF